MESKNVNGFAVTISASDCNSDYLIEEYKHCINNYMENQLIDIKTAIRQFFRDKENAESYLALVFKREVINILQPSVDYETIVIYKALDKIVVACDCLVDYLKQFSHFIMKCVPPGYEKLKLDVTAHFVRDFPTSLNNVIHLIYEINLDEMSKKLQKLYEINSKINLPTVYFDDIRDRSFIYKLFVEYTLLPNAGELNYATKESALKILTCLNDLLNLDSHYQLPSDHLKILCKFLTSRNLITRSHDAVDYKLQTLKILVILKERGQNIDAEYVSLKLFIDEYKDCYMKDIKKYNNKLKKNHGNMISERLQFLVNCRSEFLISMSKLFPTVIGISELSFFLNILGDHGDFLYLFDVKRPQLHRKKDEIFRKDRTNFSKIFEIDEELKKMDNLISFTQTKLRIIESCNLENIITILYVKFKKSSKINDAILEQFTVNTVTALIDIARKTALEEVAVAIIGILLALPKFHQQKIPAKFPLRFIKFVSQRYANFVIKFVALLKEPSDTFDIIKYLFDVLITNQETDCRTEAYNLLNKSFYKNFGHGQKEIIELEKLSLATTITSEDKFLKACENHVAKRFRITFNCFNRLTNSFGNPIVVDIICQIVTHDIQKVPPFFIKAFEEAFEEINANYPGVKFVLQIYIIFVYGKYINVKNMENLKGLLIKKELIDEVAKIMSTVSDRYGREFIPQDLIDAMKIHTKHSTYVENLMESFNKNVSDELSILRNSRMSLENRKIALCDVVTNSCNHNPFSYKILETLVLFDNDLNYDVFKALINLLPTGYNRKVSLDINKMFDALNDVNIKISDVKTLIEKDYSVDLHGVINLILSKISNEDENLVEFLEVLLNIVRHSTNTTLSDSQIKSLFYLAFSTQNYELKTKIILVITQKVSELQIQNYVVLEKWLLVKDISTQISSTQSLTKKLEILGDYLEHKLIITQDVWNALLATLHDTEQRALHPQIINCLLQISKNQNINKDMFRGVCNTIDSQSELLSKENLLLELIKHNLVIGYDLPDTLLAKICQIIESVQCNKVINLLLQIIKYSSKDIPEESLLFIANMTMNNDITIENRIISAQIISRNVKSVAIIGKLKEIALEINEEYHNLYFLPKKIAFKALENPIIEDSGSFKDFLSSHYKVLCQLFEEVVGVDIPDQLETYINDESVDAVNKFKLLCSFNNVLASHQEVDETIFQLPLETWRQKLLFAELLQNDPNNKTELDKFTHRFNELQDLSYSRNSNVSTDDILEILLDKRQEISLFSDKPEDQLNLKDINDLLVYLKTDLSPVFIKTPIPISFVSEFKLLWLKNKLEERNINCTEQNLKKILQHLPFQALTIHQLFKHISNESVAEIITFLKLLEKHIQNGRLIEQFILSQQFGNTGIRDLRLNLFGNVLKTTFNYKFQNYANFTDTISFSSILQPNAYNQGCKYNHNTYRYTKKDIDIIANELKIPYERDVNVLPAIEITGFRKLQDCFKDAVATYLESEVPTLLLVNIGKSHWINIGFIFRDGVNFVLFKDSLGDHWSSKKQMKLIAEMLSPDAENLEENAEHVENDMPTLQNVEFKFNSKAEQYSSHLGGVFALENMKIMASEISKDRNAFIEQFEEYDFVKADVVGELYSVAYPKLYVQRIIRELKSDISKQHASELVEISKYLSEKLGTSVKVKGVDDDDDDDDDESIIVSIDVLNESLVDPKGYKYFYIIERIENFEFDDLFDKEIHYTQEDTTISVGVNESFNLVTLKDKLNFCDKTDFYLQKYAEIQPTEYYRSLLKSDLGLTCEDGRLSFKDYPLLYMLQENLLKLMKIGWTYRSIKLIGAKVFNLETLSNALNGVNIIYEYNLREYDCNSKGINVLSILEHEELNLWEKEVHDIAIYQTFKGTYQKRLEELKNELNSLNAGCSYLSDEKIYNDYNMVVKASQEKSILYPNSDVIHNWQLDLCREWAERVKDKPVDRAEVNIYERLAVVKQVMTLHTRYEVREIQLLSLLLLCNCNPDSGRLLQINTGEGKTMIIAMLAVLKALDGNYVDIITSSPELASRQSVEQKLFYAYFKLDVDHIGANPKNIKLRYKSHILYGAAPDFQGDVLRDEYNKMGTRNGRKFHVAIVDEVDSMFIDGKNHIVMLSSTLPAMDYLEPILAAIWIQTGFAADSIMEKNGRAYFIERASIFNENGEPLEDADIKYTAIVGTKAEFITKAVVDHITSMIGTSNDDDSSKIKIPSHLRSFVTEIQLKHWIDSAIYAKYKCQIDMHYILMNDRIVPIDSSNTGVMQQNMRWQNGLHQFLQIKHGCKISPEGLTTNYLSNIAFFKRYGSNITGLSGTLGGDKSINLLKQVYNVDCIIVPPFKQKQYHELTQIVTSNEAMWYRNIADSCLAKVRNSRGVLIIMKYIREAEKMKTTLILQRGYDETKIKMYRTEADTNVIGEELRAGEILIATNIAGRGTDIRPSDLVENNGGLHVCVTFLPDNQRVEFQNIGRTSRTGNKGTSQFILLVENDNEVSFEQLKHERSLKEEKEIRNAMIEIEKVSDKDHVFNKFCELLNKIVVQNYPNKKVVKKAVEERFALWLKLQENDLSNIEMNYSTFEEEILQNIIDNTVIQNPVYYIMFGNSHLEQKKYIDAIEQYTKAITLDGSFATNAYYNRGYAKLAHYGENVKQNIELCQEAVEDFKKTKEIIETNLEQPLLLIQQASESEGISEQVSHKTNIYNVQKNAIDKLIETAQSAIDKKRNVKMERLDIYKSIPEDEDIDVYTDELDEYKNNGFAGNFKATEIKPIPWKTVISLALAGVGQLIAGAVLAIYTAGAFMSVGWSMILAGVQDIISAIKDGIINREFSWAAWLLDKAVSYVTTIVCCGIGSIKLAAEAVKDAAVTVASKGTTAVIQACKTGWKTAAKLIGRGVVCGLAKNGATILAEYTMHAGVRPHLERSLSDHLQRNLSTSLRANGNLRNLLEIDAKNRKNFYQKKIKDIINIIMSETTATAFGRTCLGVTQSISSAIMNNTTGSAIIDNIQWMSLANEIMGGLTHFEQLHIQFLERFNAEVAALHDQVVQGRGREEAPAEDNIQATQMYDNSDDGDIILDRGNVQQKQATLPSKAVNLEEVYDYFSKTAASSIVDLILNKAVLPLVNTGINYGTAKLGDSMKSASMNEIKNYYATTSSTMQITEVLTTPNSSEMNNVEVQQLMSTSEQRNCPVQIVDHDNNIVDIIGSERGGTPIIVNSNYLVEDTRMVNVTTNEVAATANYGEVWTDASYVQNDTQIQPDSSVYRLNLVENFTMNVNLNLDFFRMSQ